MLTAIFDSGRNPPVFPHAPRRAPRRIEHPPRASGSRLIRAVKVPKAFDVADRHIFDAFGAEGIVITPDIPLAADLVQKGVLFLDGELPEHHLAAVRGPRRGRAAWSGVGPEPRTGHGERPG